LKIHKNYHDFIIHLTQEAKQIYDDSSAVRQIIHKVRKDQSSFDRWKYIFEIKTLSIDYRFLVEKSGFNTIKSSWCYWMPLLIKVRVYLTAGKWKSIQQDRYNHGDFYSQKIWMIFKQEFFIDHKNKRTTFLDPRLPKSSSVNHRRRRARSAPTDSDDVLIFYSEKSIKISTFYLQEELGYNEKVIKFLKLPGSIDLILSRLTHECSRPKLRRKIDTVAKIGVPALKKFVNDIDLIMALRWWNGFLYWLKIKTNWYIKKYHFLGLFCKSADFLQIFEDYISWI